MIILMAKNPTPNTEVSIVPCFLENYWISAAFNKIKNLELDLLGLFSPEWSLSSHPRRSTPFILSSVEFLGMDYFTST